MSQYSVHSSPWAMAYSMHWTHGSGSIGNAYATYPWCYLDEPARAYAEASRYAYGVL